MIRVGMIDDHQFSCRALKSIFNDSEIHLLWTANSAAEGLSLSHRYPVDIIVLDYFLPDLLGLEVLRRIKRNRPEFKVIFLTGCKTVHLLARLASSKAEGLILKNSQFSLIEAITAVHAGEHYLQPDLCAELLLYQSQRDASADLTDREYEVLMMHYLGKDYEEISDQLCLSVNTIRNYKSKAMKMLDSVSNKTLLGQFFQKQELGQKC